MDVDPINYFQSQQPPITPVTTKHTKKKYKKRSIVWHHAKTMLIDGKGYLKCNYCDLKYADEGSTSNMLKHIEKQHSEKLAISREDEAVNLDDDCQNELDDEYLETKSTRKRKKNEQFLDYFLIKFIIGCCLPFQIVERPEFKDFVDKLNSSYQLPSRYRLSNDILNNFYENAIVEIKNALLDSFAIALTLDLWTSIQRYPYLGVTCHLINCFFEFKSYTIAVQHLPGQHTTENIKDALIEILKKWEIWPKTFALVTHRML
jgi:hypothetical protein